MTHTPRPREMELLRPSFYTAFTVYYCVFLGYGLTAGVLGTVTISETTPDTFGLIWGYLIALFSAAAAVGVVLSQVFKRKWVEVVSTCMLIGLMIGYAVAIGDRSYTMHDVNRVSGIWLPILASVFPTFRLFWLSAGLLRRKAAHS